MRIVIAAPYPRYEKMAEFCRTFASVFRVREDDWKQVPSFGPDYIFVPHWHWKIPKEIHEKYETIMFHATDLPIGRGGSPIKNLLAKKATSTMLTAFRCVDELDAGPVYMKVSVPILESEDKTLDSMIPAMNLIIYSIIDLKLQPTPQTGEPTYFKRLA